MTREEAAEIIDKVGNDVIAIVKKPIKDGSYTKNDIATAKEMAIRSLEAWDKVIEELREEKQKENRPYSAIQIDAFRFGIGAAIDIINKHCGR